MFHPNEDDLTELHFHLANVARYARRTRLHSILGKALSSRALVEQELIRVRLEPTARGQLRLAVPEDSRDVC